MRERRGAGRTCPALGNSGFVMAGWGAGAVVTAGLLSMPGAVTGGTWGMGGMPGRCPTGGGIPVGQEQHGLRDALWHTEQHITTVILHNLVRCPMND